MKRMRVLAAVALATVGGLWFLNGSAAQGPAAANPSTAELLERIKKLEARVADLERQTPRAVLAPLPARPLILPNGPAYPRGWIPREFNGQPYYDIPLRQADGK
jgi:hypothetical protein